MRYVNFNLLMQLNFCCIGAELNIDLILLWCSLWECLNRCVGFAKAVMGYQRTLLGLRI